MVIFNSYVSLPEGNGNGIIISLIQTPPRRYTPPSHHLILEEYAEYTAVPNHLLIAIHMAAVYVGNHMDQPQWTCCGASLAVVSMQYPNSWLV